MNNITSNKIKITFAFLLLIVILSIGSGCTSNVDNSQNENHDKFEIITSFYPVYIATINVTRGLEDVQVINMTRSQVGCLHDYQLTPSDLKLMENNDVFIINGAGMETFVDSLISENPKLNILDASQGIELIQDLNGIENAHVFVSISNEISQVENIARELSALNPINKDRYNANAKEYINKLQILKAKMHNGLKDISKREIVTFHEAFPYFAKEFGLTIAAVIEREPGATPTPRELAATIDLIKSSKISSIFVEPQYPTRTANVIAEETGAKIYVLDPMVTGEAKADAYDDYILKMEDNLRTLEEALK